MSVRIVCPAARTLTPSSTMRTPGAAAAVWGGVLLAIVLRPAVLEGAERFEEAQGDVAVHGVLADQQRHLLPEDGQVKPPVGEQQHPAGLAPIRARISCKS